MDNPITLEARLEAKLAKAVEALERIELSTDTREQGAIAMATLAELSNCVAVLEAKLAQQDDLVQAAVERGFWLGRKCGGSKAEIDAALAAIREGGK